jgi:hypothetical protein
MSSDDSPPERNDVGPTRPALQTLQVDQTALLNGDEVIQGLRDGFDSRRKVIEWYQAALVRTFGFLAEEWAPIQLLRDRTLIGALVVGPERETLVEEPLEPTDARAYRARLERNLVLPACNRAFNQLRKVAGEYVEDEDGSPGADVDPNEQQHVAMRPGFAEKDREQAATLAQLWGGFRDEQTLRDWVHRLDLPTNGAIDGELARKIGTDDVALEYLIDEAVEAPGPTAARRYRERFAIVKLLPAFETGIRRMEAGELASKSKSKLTAGRG